MSINERVLRAAIRPPDEDEYADNPANAVKAFPSFAAAPEIKDPGPASGIWADSVSLGGRMVPDNSPARRPAATACSIWQARVYEFR